MQVKDMGLWAWRRLRRGTVSVDPQARLGPDRFREIVEARVRARFDMTLSEFADAFRSGRLDDDPAAYELAVVSGASARRN